MKLFKHWVVGRERKSLLECYGWYRNMTGGWTHPHCLDFMSRSEICSYNLEQLRYKLEHGSQAALPSMLL